MDQPTDWTMAIIFLYILIFILFIIIIVGFALIVRFDGGHTGAQGPIGPTGPRGSPTAMALSLIDMQNEARLNQMNNRYNMPNNNMVNNNMVNNMLQQMNNNHAHCHPCDFYDSMSGQISDMQMIEPHQQNVIRWVVNNSSLMYDLQGTWTLQPGHYVLDVNVVYPKMNDMGDSNEPHTRKQLCVVLRDDVSDSITSENILFKDDTLTINHFQFSIDNHTTNKLSITTRHKSNNTLVINNQSTFNLKLKKHC